MSAISFKSIYNSAKYVNEELIIDKSNVIILPDAFEGILSLRILFDGKITNLFKILIENNSWLGINQNYVTDKNDYNFNLYIDNNYTDTIRYCYISITSNIDGETSTLVIQQPPCNFKIETTKEVIKFPITKKDENGKDIKVYEDVINLEVYGASKVGLVNSSFIDIERVIQTNAIQYNGQIYTVENDKITIDEYHIYPVLNERVNVNGIEYAVINNIVTIPTDNGSDNYIVEDGKIKIENENGEYDEYEVQYGKFIVIEDNIFYNIKDITEMYDYDNSLYFKLILNNKESEFNEYTLNIEYLGKFNDEIEYPYYYNFYVLHRDNPSIKKLIKIEIQGTDQETNGMTGDAILNTFDKVYIQQQTNADNTIRDRNEKNKSESFTVTNIKSMIFLNKIKQVKYVEEYLDGITNVNINENIISLQTNIYNYNNEIEHDSMILVQPKALWCTATTEYKNGLHYINVSCTDNFWGEERKTLLVIKNAENMSARKNFIISQSIDNIITIKEQIKD